MIIVIIIVLAVRKSMKKFSRKREAILQKVQSTTLHPSAEWVYSELKPKIPDLSLGTVYRNLSGLKKDGVITSVGAIRGEERFDGNTSEHSHFICEFCGAVRDVDVVVDRVLAAEVAARFGGEVTRVNQLFFGKCENCKK